MFIFNEFFNSYCVLRFYKKKRMISTDTLQSNKNHIRRNNFFEQNLFKIKSKLILLSRMYFECGILSILLIYISNFNRQQN